MSHSSPSRGKIFFIRGLQFEPHTLVQPLGAPSHTVVVCVLATENKVRCTPPSSRWRYTLNMMSPLQTKTEEICCFVARNCYKTVDCLQTHHNTQGVHQLLTDKRLYGFICAVECVTVVIRGILNPALSRFTVHLMRCVTEHARLRILAPLQMLS